MAGREEATQGRRLDRRRAVGDWQGRGRRNRVEREMEARLSLFWIIQGDVGESEGAEMIWGELGRSGGASRDSGWLG